MEKQGLISLSESTPLPLFKTEQVRILAKDLKMEAKDKDSSGVALGSSYVLSSSEKLSAGSVKKALKVQPEIKFDVEQIADNEVKVLPKGALTEDTVYKFTLANATESVQDDPSWAFQTKNPFRVINSLPRSEATNAPLNSGIEITFSHENYQDLNDFFTISPNVSGRFERHKRTAVFIPKGLAPATVYTVTLKEGLGLAGSAEKLTHDFSFQFETAKSPETNPIYLSFMRRFFEFPSSEKPALGLNTYQIAEDTQIPFEVFRYKNQEAFLEAIKKEGMLPLWASASRSSFLYPADTLEKVASFKSPLQKSGYNSYVIFPEPLPNGYYLVQIEYSGNKRQSLLQITDLATYLTTSQTKSLLWVNDIGTGQAMAGAKVSLVDTDLQKQTDNSGIAYFDTPKELKENKKHYYFSVITSNGKSVVIPVIEDEHFRYSYWGSYHDRQSSAKEDFWSYLYLDRPMYLPNDKISFWGIIRKRENPGGQVNLTIKLTQGSGYYYDYNQEETIIFEKEIKTSNLGTFHDEISLSNLKPGWYQIQVVQDKTAVTSSWFSVSDYTKPAYQISVSSERKAIFAGETLKINGKTAFFEGTPVVNTTLKYSGEKPGELVSNQKGEFELSYVPPYVDNENTRYPLFQRFEFTPKLSEEGEIVGASSVRIFGPNIDLSAKTSLDGETKAKVEMAIKEITLERLNSGAAKDDNDYLGTPIAKQKIDGQIYLNRWEKQEVGTYYDFINKKTSKKYQYNYIREYLKDFSVTTDANGQASYFLDIEKEKSYEIKLTTKDVNGKTARQTVYAYGSLYSQSGDDEASYWLTKTDKAENYGLGEKVSLVIKKNGEILPSETLPRVLFILAQRGIRQYELKKDPNYSFDFSEEFIPNVLAKAVYFNGRTFVLTDSLNLPYRFADKKLDIELQTDKVVYQPAEEVKIGISVKDKNGRGQVSEVNLSLVDEAFFALEDQRVDTLGSLYTNIASGIIQTYFSHQYPPGFTSGGGGAACFLEGTKVKMADGSYRSIEEIKVGEYVLTRENESSSKQVLAKVTKLYEHKVGYILLINENLWVTPEHRMFISGQWQEIGRAKIGDLLLTENNEWKPITSIEQKYGSFKVYNLEVENLKTYLAGGFYVHNQKERQHFADKAFFGVVQTDTSGHGQASFKLPDNLTSWRITYQAVTADLMAGSGKKSLPVHLPFFVDMGLNKQYLATDEPVIKIRSFGESLTSSQEIEYKIKISSLGVDPAQVIKAKAFEVAEYKLPKLKVGEHKIEITGKAGGLEDKLIRSIRVNDSYLQKTTAKFSQLTSETKLENPDSLPSTLVFSDKNRGQYLSSLTSLFYSFGDRVDQKLARIKSAELLKNYFGEEVFSDEDFNGAMYQVSADGGISLFPYSSSEVELSAKIAALASEKFDKLALRQYFLKIIDDKNSGTEQGAAALYGLAALGEPVLLPLQQLSQQKDITPVARLYLALGMIGLGDKQTAFEIYQTLLKQYGEKMSSTVRLNVGADQDDVLQATSLVAQLGALLADEQSDLLFRYVLENGTKDVLVYLEQISYFEAVLPLTNPEAVSFTYELDGQTQNKSLAKGKTYKLILTPEQAQKIKFSNIQGNVGLTQTFQVRLTAENITKSANASVSRIYTVSNRQSQNFSETDLVKVQLTYKLGSKAADGCYQVTDYMPSGLRPIANLESRGISDRQAWYPYEVNGQKVSFCVYKTGEQKPIIYYARVVSKGKYTAESAIIQSQKSPSDLNLSQSSLVNIQ